MLETNQKFLLFSKEKIRNYEKENILSIIFITNFNLGK